MAGQDRDRVGILVPPPVYPLLALGAAFALDRWIALPAVPLAVRAAGAVLAAASLGVALWAVAAFVRHHTPVDPYHATKALVETGPYRWTRNPIYLAFVGATAGLGLSLGWWWALATTPAVLLALDLMVVRREEGYLARKFGPAYDEYRRRVRRWL